MRVVSLAERSKAPDSSSGGAIRVGSNPTADILQELERVSQSETSKYYKLVEELFWDHLEIQLC